MKSPKKTDRKTVYPEQLIDRMPEFIFDSTRIFRYVLPADCPPPGLPPAWSGLRKQIFSCKSSDDEPLRSKAGRIEHLSDVPPSNSSLPWGGLRRVLLPCAQGRSARPSRRERGRGSNKTYITDNVLFKIHLSKRKPNNA